MPSEKTGLDNELATSLLASITSYFVSVASIVEIQAGRSSPEAQAATRDNLQGLAETMAAWAQWLRGPECDLDGDIRLSLQALTDCLTASMVAAARSALGFKTWLTSDEQLDEILTPQVKEWLEARVDPNVLAEIARLISEASQAT